MATTAFNRIFLFTLGLILGYYQGKRRASKSMTSTSTGSNNNNSSSREVAAPNTWGYGGRYGPCHWHLLDHKWKVAAEGKRQSPVDLKANHVIPPGKQTELLEFKWDLLARVRVVHGERGITFNVSSGNVLYYQGKAYTLLQFHYHTPSEHRLEDVHGDLELHFVSQCVGSDQLLVCGVIYKVHEGEDDAFTQGLKGKIPANKGEEAEITKLDLPALLKEVDSFKSRYTYEGSLTTPPCSETVQWVVAEKELGLSPATFNEMRAATGFNSRHTMVAAYDSP